MLLYDCGNKEYKNWIICETSFDAQLLGKCESIMALGNGYMGLRSSMEENYTKQTRGLFIAGTFNKFDCYEPSELPNAADVVELEIVLNNEVFSLEKGVIYSYQRSLNLKTGELARHIIWESPSKDKYELCFKRFVSLDNLHLIGMKVYITPLTGESCIRVTSGINGQMTNSGVQHFHEGEKRIYDQNIMEFIQTTCQSKIDFIFHSGHTWKIDSDKQIPTPRMIISRRKLEMMYDFMIPKGKTLIMEKICTVHTSLDKSYCYKEYSLQDLRDKTLTEFIELNRKGYDLLFDESAKKWKRYWKEVDIKIESKDSFDQLAVRFAQYHLLIMTPAHDSRFGIGAKGLTGEGYKGHTFWDSEIFILPYFTFTNPQIARKLLEYRYHTLNGARKKAIKNGFEGAMYPWESAFTGDEETPEWGAVNILTGEATRILSGLKEQHITCDIAYALWQYYKATQDIDFMKKYGSEILFETASFWAKRVEWDEEKKSYCINDVIGPDEYKEQVNNNAFTNYMAHWNIQTAINHYRECKEKMPQTFKRLNKKLDLERRFKLWNEVVDKIYLPQPRKTDKVIPQDDTYLSKPLIDITKYKNASAVQTILQDYSREQVNNMQVSKQADVVMLLYLLKDKFSKDVKEANWQYYEPKTLHDSSLSLSVHCIVACDINDKNTAYDFFKKAAQIDLGPNMKSSDLGIHAASLGGIWKAIVFGFAGISIEDDKLHINPKIPPLWLKLKLPLKFQGYNMEIEITRDCVQIKNKTKTDYPLEIFIGNDKYLLKEKLRVDLQGVSPQK